MCGFSEQLHVNLSLVFPLPYVESTFPRRTMLLCVHAPPHGCRTCAVVAGQNPVLLASCLSHLTSQIRQRASKFLY